MVTVPGPGAMTGKPTDLVFCGGNAFQVMNGKATGPARFIFAEVDGGIAAWAPTVDGTHALRVIDNANIGAVYKGIALSGTGTSALL